jgi:hypothetical protein
MRLGSVVFSDVMLMFCSCFILERLAGTVLERQNTGVPFRAFPLPKRLGGQWNGGTAFFV